MATQSERLSDLKFDRRGTGSRAAEKPKTNEEMGLCLVLIALVAWALFAGLRTVDWPAVGHTFQAILAWI